MNSPHHLDLSFLGSLGNELGIDLLHSHDLDSLELQQLSHFRVDLELLDLIVKLILEWLLNREVGTSPLLMDRLVQSNVRLEAFELSRALQVQRIVEVSPLTLDELKLFVVLDLHIVRHGSTEVQGSVLCFEALGVVPDFVSVYRLETEQLAVELVLDVLIVALEHLIVSQKLSLVDTVLDLAPVDLPHDLLVLVLRKLIQLVCFGMEQDVPDVGISLQPIVESLLQLLRQVLLTLILTVFWREHGLMRKSLCFHRQLGLLKGVVVVNKSL